MSFLDLDSSSLDLVLSFLDLVGPMALDVSFLDLVVSLLDLVGPLALVVRLGSWWPSGSCFVLLGSC